MKKLILSIAVSAIFLFALCHTAIVNGYPLEKIDGHSQLHAEIYNKDNDDSVGYKNLPGHVEVESVSDDDDHNDISVDYESDLDFIPKPVEIKDGGKFHVPGLKIPIVPGNDDQSEPGVDDAIDETPVETDADSGGNTDSDDFTTTEATDGSDIASADAVNTDDLGSTGADQDSDDFNIKIVPGDPVIGGAFGGHCSMVGDAPVNAAALLLVALAVVPMTIRRKK